MARELHGATQTLHFTSSGCPLAAVAVTDSPRAPSSSTTHTLALVPTELRAEEHTGAILPPLPAMSPACTEAERCRPAPRPGLALRRRARHRLCEATSLPEPQITPKCPDFTAAQPRGHTPQPCGRRGSSQTHQTGLQPNPRGQGRLVPGCAPAPSHGTDLLEARQRAAWRGHEGLSPPCKSTHTSKPRLDDGCFSRNVATEA